MNRTARRSLVALFVALVGTVALGGPASARPPAGSFTGPAEGDILATSRPSIQGHFTQEGGVVDRINLRVTSDRSGTGASIEWPGQNSSTLSFRWEPNLSYNGPYTAEAVATGSERPVDTTPGEQSPKVVRRFSLENPPVPPADVSTSVDPQSRHVTITWKDNPEPDMIGYQVQRAEGTKSGSPFKAIGSPTDTKWVDRTVTSGGDYRYQVVAIRKGATDTGGVSSDPSAASVASVPAPPPPSTVAPSPGGGSGGSGSGSGGTTGAGSSGSTGSTSSGSSGSAGPTIAKSGRVNLSGFDDLLNQARLPARPSPFEPDTGFSEELPFGAAPPDAEQGDEADPATVTLGRPVSRLEADSSERIKSFAVLAGGLICFVMFMQVVWVKREVDRDDLQSIDESPAEAEDLQPIGG